MSACSLWLARCLTAALMAVAAADGGAEKPARIQPATTQPTPLAVPLSIDERLERLSGLLGPSVEIAGPAVDSGRARVRANLRFEAPAELQPFAVMTNRWEVRDGSLHGSGIAVSQIVFALPLLSESCTVRSRLRSDCVLEMSLLNPLVERFDGTRAVGRLHFGRMEPRAPCDWIELSSRDRSLKRIYEFRFPDRMQEASLVLADGKLDAELTIDHGSKSAHGRVLPAALSRNVYVSLAGGVNNKVEVDRLDIDGWIDLNDDRITILTGMGRPYWGDGREVTIYYRARGQFRRLLHNGEPVAEQQPTEGIWWPTLGSIHRTTLRLAYGDVLAFELGGVDDEGALHAVGEDRATGTVVLATHPLVFETTAGPPDEAWFRTFGPSWTTRPHISVSQDEPTVERLNKTLDADFPGLPIIGPWVDDERRVYLKTQIR